MAKFKFGIFLILCLFLSSCKSVLNMNSRAGEQQQDELYYDYDYDFYDYDTFDRG